MYEENLYKSSQQFYIHKGMHVGERGLPDRGIIDKPNKVETWCKTCTKNSAFWLHE